MKLRICHMYPDVLNLYGDRGNVICMKQRLERRGIDAEITELPVGERSGIAESDLLFIGGGQDFEQEILLSDLSGEKTASLKAAIEDGVPVLAICGGYQMLGHYYETHTGAKYGFTGLVDLYTVGDAKRMVGDIMFVCGRDCGGSTIVGFENHSGKTYLGSGLSPLGRVISGYGNNGTDGTEGVRYKNVFGSYCHGPMLPKNPDFCDYLLACALERKYGRAELAPLDDSIELIAHNEIVRRLSKHKGK